MKLWERVIEARLMDIVPICGTAVWVQAAKKYYECNICTQSVDGEA